MHSQNPENMVITGRIAAKRQIRSYRYEIYSQAENQHFRPAGATRSTDSCVIAGSLGGAKFHANRCPRWERGPQNGKNIHFLVKSRPAGANPLTDFYNFRGFYTPNYTPH